MTSDNPQWFWNASANPFSPTHEAVWTPYSSEDNKKIEQHFQNKTGKVELQSHTIHFQERMQVHRSDFNKQRPVKREPNK